MSLNNASTHYSSLAAAAEDDQQRRQWLGKAVDAIEEAAEIYRRLSIPANLGTAMANAANAWHALARLEENDDKQLALGVKACESIDGAIRLFEQTGQNIRLLQAYPHGVEVHSPLMSRRPESLTQTRIYAEKAARLLAAFGKAAEAEHFSQLAQELAGQIGE